MQRLGEHPCAFASCPLPQLHRLLRECGTEGGVAASAPLACKQTRTHTRHLHPLTHTRTRPTPQDTEFTVQDGRLFMLQTRNGKRTGVAALRVAIEMEEEGLVTADEAVLMVEPRHLDQLLHPMFVNEKVGGRGRGGAMQGRRKGGVVVALSWASPAARVGGRNSFSVVCACEHGSLAAWPLHPCAAAAQALPACVAHLHASLALPLAPRPQQAYQKHVFAKGLAASPGAAVGKIVFTAEAAEEAAKNGEHVILCRTVGGAAGWGVVDGAPNCLGMGRLGIFGGRVAWGRGSAEDSAATGI